MALTPSHHSFGHGAEVVGATVDALYAEGAGRYVERGPAISAGRGPSWVKRFACAERRPELDDGLDDVIREAAECDGQGIEAARCKGHHGAARWEAPPTFSELSSIATRPSPSARTKKCTCVKSRGVSKETS